MPSFFYNQNEFSSEVHINIIYSLIHLPSRFNSIISSEADVITTTRNRISAVSWESDSIRVPLIGWKLSEATSMSAGDIPGEMIGFLFPHKLPIEKRIFISDDGFYMRVLKIKYLMVVVLNCTL